MCAIKERRDEWLEPCREDENLLDELHDIARRLEDRMTTIERIIAADDPNWKKSA